MAKHSDSLVSDITCAEGILTTDISTNTPFPEYLYLEKDCMKKDSEFLDSKYNRKATTSSDYYKCHANILKAKQNCKLDGIHHEATCRDTAKEACSGAVLKGHDVKCGAQIPEYSECIANQFDKNDAFPFQGVNCLHSYMTPPPCAKNANPSGRTSHSGTSGEPTRVRVSAGKKEKDRGRGVTTGAKIETKIATYKPNRSQSSGLFP